MFAALGRTVLSADDIGRELTNTRDDIKSAIRAAFGPDVILPDGTPDRARLAEIVFSHPPSRRKLDAIIHPHVFTAIDSALARLATERSLPYVLIEAALVYETGMDRHLDHVIVVTADEETRIQRVLARRGESREKVVARMKAQMAPQKQLQRADFVIDNSGTPAELDEKVKFLDTILSMMK